MSNYGHSTRDIAFRCDKFSERVDELIERNGLTVSGFAPSIGYERKAVYRWRDNATIPSADAIFTICCVYGVDANWLLGLEA